MNAAGYKALERLAAYREDTLVKWASAAELQITPQVLGGLVRRGYARSTEQSEHVRGERRTTWRLYQITQLGLRYVPLPDAHRFGYEHNAFMRDLTERLCEARGLDPLVFNAEVYLDACWGWNEHQRRKPTMRQRQEAARERGEPWVAPLPQQGPLLPRAGLTSAELAYLVGLLQFQNEPLAASILDKLAGRLHAPTG